MNMRCVFYSVFKEPAMRRGFAWRALNEYVGGDGMIFDFQTISCPSDLDIRHTGEFLTRRPLCGRMRILIIIRPRSGRRGGGRGVALNQYGQKFVSEVLILPKRRNAAGDGAGAEETCRPRRRVRCNDCGLRGAG